MARSAGNAVAVGLVLLISLLLAGCVSFQEESTTEADPGEDVTTSGSGNANLAVDGSPRDTGSAPTVEVRERHDFLHEDPTEVTFEVPPGAWVTTVHLFIGGYESEEGLTPEVCAAQPETPEIRILGPSGEVWAGVQATGFAIGGTCSDAIHRTGQATALAQGTWAIQFTGTAAAVGHVILE